MRQTRLIILLTLTLVAAVANAVTIHVPGDQPTIQRGINAAVDGDTVMIEGGTYSGESNRDLDFGGRKIVVRSGNGQVTIDCGGSESDPHRGFTFHSGEDSNSVLFRIHIENAWSDSGAIFVTNATPTIRQCRIYNNNASGIRCEPDWPWPDWMNIIDCDISDNTGHGIELWAARVRINSCYISGNDSNGVSILWSGEVDMSWSTIADNGGTGFWAFTFGNDYSLVNCTFANNKKGIWWDANYPAPPGIPKAAMFDTARIENCLFAFNQETGIEYLWEPVGLLARCNDSWGNPGGDYVGVPWHAGDDSGNISADPLFCGEQNYSLWFDSPCLPKNNSCLTRMGSEGEGCCCRGIRGNVDGDPDDLVNIADLTYLVGYMFGGGPQPPCFDESNVNGDGGPGGGSTSIPDLTYLVAYLFGGGPEPPECW